MDGIYSPINEYSEIIAMNQYQKLQEMQTPQSLSLEGQIALREFERHGLHDRLLQEQLKEKTFKLQFHHDAKTSTEDLYIFSKKYFNLQKFVKFDIWVKLAITCRNVKWIWCPFILEQTDSKTNQTTLPVRKQTQKIDVEINPHCFCTPSSSRDRDVSKSRSTTVFSIRTSSWLLQRKTLLLPKCHPDLQPQTDEDLLCNLRLDTEDQMSVSDASDGMAQTDWSFSVDFDADEATWNCYCQIAYLNLVSEQSKEKKQVTFADESEGTIRLGIDS